MRSTEAGLSHRPLAVEGVGVTHHWQDLGGEFYTISLPNERDGYDSLVVRGGCAMPAAFPECMLSISQVLSKNRGHTVNGFPLSCELL